MFALRPAGGPASLAGGPGWIRRGGEGAYHDRVDGVVDPAIDADALLDDLDADQRRAVTAESRLVAVIAGAGSGKTRVLTRRVAHRILTGSAEARHTLVLTFTREAAGELRRGPVDLGEEVIEAAAGAGVDRVGHQSAAIGHDGLRAAVGVGPAVLEDAEHHRVERAGLDPLTDSRPVEAAAQFIALFANITALQRIWHVRRQAHEKLKE